MLADPQLVDKVRRNQVETVKPCIGDLMCITRMFSNKPYICTVNPILGHEVEPEYHIQPTRNKKKVMIIGAGISGLECGLAAAKRGHTVQIYDKEKEIGGQLRYAARDQGGEKYLSLLKYYAAALERSGIELFSRTNVDKDLCAKVSPDVVVLATGARIHVPPIPGINSDTVYDAYYVLDHELPKTETIVVLGGGKLGIIAAEILAKRNKKVMIVEEASRIDHDLPLAMKWRHNTWIKELKIGSVVNAGIKEIKGHELVFQNGDGKEQCMKADAFVIAYRESNQDLALELEWVTDELFLIGDAIKPRFMHNAIHEGYRLGIRI